MNAGMHTHTHTPLQSTVQSNFLMVCSCSLTHVCLNLFARIRSVKSNVLFWYIGDNTEEKKQNWKMSHLLVQLTQSRVPQSHWLTESSFSVLMANAANYSVLVQLSRGLSQLNNLSLKGTHSLTQFPG